MGSGADPPHMQIRDPSVPRRFDMFPNLRLELRIRGIQQHLGRVSHQRPRPARDYRRADDAHHRVEPYPAEEAAGEQRNDCEPGRQRIGEHMGDG